MRDAKRDGSRQLRAPGPWVGARLWMRDEATSRRRVEQDAWGPALTFDSEEGARIQRRDILSASEPSGARWMGGYRFPVNRAGIESSRSPQVDADMILASSKSRQNLRNLCSEPRTSAVENGKHADSSDRVMSRLLRPASRCRRRRNRRTSGGRFRAGSRWLSAHTTEGLRQLFNPESRIPPYRGLGQDAPICRKVRRVDTRISLTDVHNRVELAEEKKTATDWEQAVLVAGFTRPVLERARVGPTSMRKPLSRPERDDCGTSQTSIRRHPPGRSAMRMYAVAPIQYRGVAMRHVGPRDAIRVPLSPRMQIAMRWSWRSRPTWNRGAS